MRIRIVTAVALPLLALAFCACTNTQPAYYGTYPTDYPPEPVHGYDAYASAPYDPYGAYYQNYAPATPYYYEPPESHRNCDERPCIAYQVKPPVRPEQTEKVAAPEKPEPFNPPSTISRPAHVVSRPHATPLSSD